MSPPEHAMFDYATELHLGNIRGHQEDEVFADARSGVFGVLDGMGGQRTGEWAVRRAVISLEDSMQWWSGSTPVFEGLERALFEAAERVAFSEYDEEVPWMTTATLAAFRGAWVVIKSVGDTRAYVSRDGALTRLTRDDRLLGSILSSRRLTAQEIAEFPHKNIVMNVIGPRYDPRPHTAAWHLLPGDRVLLCSDGLSDWVSDADIAELLSGAPCVADAAAALRDACLATEARDNLAVVVIDPLSPRGPLFEDPPPRDLWGDLRSALHAPGVDGWFRVTELLDAASGHAEWEDLFAYVATSVEKWPVERARPVPPRWMLDVWRDVRERPELALCDTLHLPMGWAPPDLQWLELIARAEFLHLPRLDPDWDLVDLNVMDTLRDYSERYAPAWIEQIDAELAARQARVDALAAR